MIRAHKIRLNPTIEQEAYFWKAAGTKRFVYNQALDLWKWGKQVGAEGFGVMEIKRQFNMFKEEQYPWMYEVAKDIFEGAFVDLGKALTNYFDSKSRKRKGAKMGFPKPKRKKDKKQSFRLNNDRVSVDGHDFIVPNAGKVNMAEKLRFNGKIMSITVSQVAGHWYASFQVEIQRFQPKKFEKKSTGVDVGIKSLAVLSDGSEFENQKPLRNQIKKLRRLSRSLSRKKGPTKGGKGKDASKRWWKKKQKLAKFHQKVANKRTDAQHKASHEIASTYAFIGVEDLHVKGMFKNRKLALSISDVGLGEFVRQIEYKSAGFGGQVVRVGRFFASSKTCNDCGHINQQLELKERTWTCSGCRTIHDRDWNAAKNIEQEALRIAFA